MKKSVLSLGLVASLSLAAQAQVYISEILSNPIGGDGGMEYFELRGTPGMSLEGYYLLSLEGQLGSLGDINQFFDLGAFSIGVNGYLFAVQLGSPYTPIAPGATYLSNSVGVGWGQVNGAGSSVGHYSDASQTDLENSAVTFLLINRGLGVVPDVTLDLDTDNDGFLDLPAGWSIVDSVGLFEGAGQATTDRSYGAITFANAGLGLSEYGPIFEVASTAVANIYVARKGESTGYTLDDWFGATTSGSAGNFTFNITTDPFYAGKPISFMEFGGPNPIPEPGVLSLLGMGLVALFLRRRK